MKKKILVSLLSVSLITTSIGALAHPRNDHGDRGRVQQGQYRGDQRQDNRYEGQRDQRRDYRNEGWRYEQRYEQRDERREWRGGAYYPSSNYGYGQPPYAYSRQYEVYDWRARHLSAPPRGYYWADSGSGYVLAAIATGVILDWALRHAPR